MSLALLAVVSCGDQRPVRVLSVESRHVDGSATAAPAIALVDSATSVAAGASTAPASEPALPSVSTASGGLSDVTASGQAGVSEVAASTARRPTNATATTTSPTTVAPSTVASTTMAPTTVAPTTVPVTEPPAPSPPTTAVVAPLSVPLAPMTRGAQGDDVKVLQQRLLDLGFWLDDADGVYGSVTAQAVMAFQKYAAATYNLDPSGNADRATVDALATTSTRPQSLADEGDLVEIDKARQLLFIVRDGQVAWVLNASTGSSKPYTETNRKLGGTVSGDAITPEGEFKIYRQYAKGWETGELGELYRPKYFKGGVAIHGHGNVPNYPASHGCVRVSLAAMDWIWANEIMAMGQRVWVHGAP